MIDINRYIKIKCCDLIPKINPYKRRWKSHPYVILRYHQLPSLIVSNNWPKMADPYSTRSWVCSLCFALGTPLRPSLNQMGGISKSLFLLQAGSMSGDPHVHRISSVSSSHEGSYSCVAENVLGQAQQVAYLAVSHGHGMGRGVGVVWAVIFLVVMKMILKICWSKYILTWLLVMDLVLCPFNSIDWS